MRHCCSFDALDIWYLKDDDIFCNRVLYIGFCPQCKKPVIELSQQNKSSHVHTFIKKIGPKASEFAKELIKEKVYALSDINKNKFTTKPYGWRYGVNKEIKLANGTTIIKQYAKDFYGNKTLIKNISS